MLKHNDRLLNKTPIVLLSAFLGVCVLTTLSSVHYDQSLRSCIQQVVYFLLFFLASNAIRNNRAMGIILAGLVIGILLNTLWTVIHATYILPYVRERIASDPAVLQYYFGTTVLTPELKHRLEMGRAFGTFLFPNALGGFLALCLPYVLGELIGGMNQFKQVLVQDKLDKIPGLKKAMFIGLLATFSMGACVYGLSQYLLMKTDGNVLLISGVQQKLYYFGFFPVVLGVFSVYLVRLKGLQGFTVIIKTLMLCFVLPLVSYGLWMTFSRGAWLGAAFGIGLSSLLVLSGYANIMRINSVAKIWLRVAMILLITTVASMSALASLNLEDDGFLMPDPELDWRIKSETHEVSDLDTAGEAVDAEDVMSTTSLSYRMSYWRVGLVMARAHRFKGVGLGNFGTMYGQYQFLDAYDVKMAHNDYLQTLVETGLFGFIFFVSFWVYFVVWGGARILKETELSRRLVLAGLYAGVVAFLVQAIFDFNFMNPSLASMVYIIAGLFYARAWQYEENTGAKSQSNNRRVIVLIFLLVLLCIYPVARQFRYDFSRTAGDVKTRLNQIGDERRVRLKIDVTKYLLNPQVQSYLPNQQDANGNPLAVPRVTVESLRELISNDEDLIRLGPIRVLLEDNSGNTRALNPGEMLSKSDYVFVIHPEVARELTYKYSDKALQSFKELDANYPHGLFLCDLSSDWIYELLRGSNDPRQKLRYAQDLLIWSEKRAERNPHDPSALVDLSRAYWERGRVDQTLKQLDYYRDGIETYRKASQLYPTAHDLQQNFGEAMTNMGNAFVKAGLKDEGNGYLLEGEEAYNRARWLARYKQDILNLR